VRTTVQQIDALEVAHRTALRIAAEALWSNGECTWLAPRWRAARSGGSHVDSATTGNSVYQGAAGIALFLAEAYALTRDSALVSPIRGALRRAASTTDRRGAVGLGFFVGQTGVAHALWRSSQVLGSEELAVEAGSVLSRIQSTWKSDDRLDVFAGCAGAIPALLGMASGMPMPEMVDVAIGMGDRIISQACALPLGWCWAVDPTQAMRGRTGLAHGAAGYAYSLLELFAATAEARFRVAAEFAFDYERSVYDQTRRNWPDLRNTELRRGMANHPDRVVLRDKLWPRHLTKEVPRLPTTFKHAWCHGSGGIALTRLRAFEITKDARYLSEAKAAIATTCENLDDLDEYNLCHGSFGRSEVLLTAARALNDHELKAKVLSFVDEAIHVWQENNEGWSREGEVANPSLMLGSAGIGYALLRVHSVSVPPILTLKCQPVAAKLRRGIDLHQTHQTLEQASQSFQRVIRVFGRLSPSGAAVAQRAVEVSRGSLTQLFEALSTAIVRETDPVRQGYLMDAFAPERLQYLVSTEFFGTDSLMMEQFAVSSAMAQSERPDVVQLASHVRCVRCAYDWDLWLDSASASEPPEESPLWYATTVSGGLIRAERLRPITALVLRALDCPMSVPELVDAVRRSADPIVPRDPQECLRLVEHEIAALGQQLVRLPATTGTAD
jgi:hypothetical protein